MFLLFVFLVTFFFKSFLDNDALKTLTTLRSSSQPTVKKRQLMRQTFGDYRSKMAEDEKTYSIGKFNKKNKFLNKIIFN